MMRGWDFGHESLRRHPPTSLTGGMSTLALRLFGWEGRGGGGGIRCGDGERVSYEQLCISSEGARGPADSASY